MGPSSQRGESFFLPGRTSFACEDVASGSQQSGGESFFLPGRTSLRAKMSLVGPSSQGESFFSRNMVAHPVGPSSQGETTFSQNTGGPSGGSLVSGGGIINLHVTRRHFLASAVDPAVSLSTYSPRPMEAVP